MIGSFDKRLAELDAYLQMLIEQSDFLDEKIELNEADRREKDSLSQIKANLDTLISSIKHSIVLLQIAKVSIESSPKAGRSTNAVPSYNGTSSSAKASSKLSKLKGKLSSESNSSLVSSVLGSAIDKAVSGGDKKSDSKQPLESSGESSELQQQSQPESSSQTARRHTSNSNTTHLVTSPSSSSQSSSTAALKDYPPPHQPPPPPPASTILHTPGSSIQLDQHRNPTTLGPQLEQQLSVQQLQEPVDELTGGGSSNAEHDEEDDAFFDADEHQHQHQICDLTDINETSTPRPAPENRVATSNKQQPAIEPRDLSNNNNNIIISTMSSSAVEKKAEDGIDWDLMYEEEEGEEELGTLENHGSVIKHLLSQIRIGMDLTKVVLPTFILERRSLLEMYADFFAHPDLFSSIPDYNTPEERLIQLVRWYLSAFHAGRKSSVAKKPYNPVLGEIFLCNWNLDGDETQSSDKQNELSSTISSNSTKLTQQQASAGVSANRLTFVAEQVSHHPPISAFYAENPEKLISCTAHIYTKSKYLGLSVGVHNIGEGIVSLLKHNENYVCTFPSAYGRSILTVPWVELGGSVHITCKETGYTANIEFLTKPFYGGKKHRVTAELVRPNKQTFMVIEGEWNGCMHFKLPPNSSDKKMFVNTSDLPVIKKNVKPVTQQESCESRNVWKEVTRALKEQDVSGATNAKSFIEQRQRDLLKERLEQGIKWKPRYFEEADEAWLYTSPLADRLSQPNDK